MAREHLAKRANWQAKAGLGGQGREETAKKILVAHFRKNEIFECIEKPPELKKIYGGQWGIMPDFAIRNKVNGKIAFFETKRQGKGGNAHERACKYFAPGVELAGEKVAKFERPFFFIFMDALTSDKKKRKEIETWFDAPGYEDRRLFWGGKRDVEELIEYCEYVANTYLV